MTVDAPRLARRVSLLEEETRLQAVNHLFHCSAGLEHRQDA
jgi:hypothetical protein